VPSLPTNLKRAVFLDRDGVINQVKVVAGKPFPATSLDEFVLLPGVVEACRRLKAAGFLLVVATNQPDVGRGTLDQRVVETIHRHLLRVLPIDRVEVCYHPGIDDSECDCRKPKPGMLRRAAAELGLDLARSFMVGDRWRDIDCGHAAGCHTILVDHGYEEPLRQPPDFRVKSLLEAADVILGGAR
jgi:D-glycero-D-manno-heptose 1,7-bisphosphate phosphatase